MEYGSGGDGDGMSPRKRMASGSGGNFGVGSHPGTGDKPHPDLVMGTGSAGHMADGERGIGGPINHAPGHLPAQAAPKHGPHFERELGFDRGGKA